MAYWRQKLSGQRYRARAAHRPAAPGAPQLQGGHHASAHPPVLYEGLRRFGRAQGFTLYMDHAVRFFTLLSRYTGQDDVLSVPTTPPAGARD